MAREFDVVVVGAGHNGLVTACYLARAGLRVRVLERRDVVGGACVSEELWPGYKVSTTSYVTTLFDPRIVRDFDLERHGYRVYKQEPAFFQPFPDGRSLLPEATRRGTRPSIASSRPATRSVCPSSTWPSRSSPDLARTIASMRPPNLPASAGRASRRLVRLRRPCGACRPADLRRFVEIATAGILDYIEPWFESEEVRAFYCSQAVIGAYGGVHTPGTAALLLHDFLGGIEGARGVWGVVRWRDGDDHPGAGGGGARAGGHDHDRRRASSGSWSRKVRAVGVVLEGGEEIRARAVASSADPRRTFLGLTPPAALPAEFRQAIERYKSLGASLKVHLALGELPDFTAMRTGPGGAPGPQHRGLVVLCPSAAYIERAWDEAKRGDLCQEPMVEACLHSVLDETAAPAGKHVMSCFVQYGARHLAQGSWSALKPVVAERVIRRARALRPQPAGRGGGLARLHSRGPGAGVRPHGREHLPRGDDARAALLLPAGGGLLELRQPGGGPLPVRLRRPPGRRRVGRGGDERGERDPEAARDAALSAERARPGLDAAPRLSIV